MSQEVQVVDIVTFLETDLKEVIQILDNPEVYEVMLNPYLLQNGQYEGHLWYEANGVGMRRVITESMHTFSKYPLPKIGDLVVIKTNHDGTSILNYQILPLDKNFYKALKIVLCYTLKENDDNSLYLEQAEHYRLVELGNYIQTGYYGYKLPIPKDVAIEDILNEINDKYLANLDITFRLHAIEVSEDIQTQFKAPKYSISKEFMKMDFILSEQIIGILASANEKHAHKYDPIVEVQIPFYGHRFTGVLPPVAKFPFWTIRKHSSQVKTLEQYVEEGIMPQKAADILRKWTHNRLNILIGGSVGSGKTTLLNTLLRIAHQETPNDRVGIIEDTPEVQCFIENSYSIATTDEVTLSKLLRTSFRLSANRLVVGEIRGAEAYVLLKALTGGFRGCMGTIHADGAAHALFRFEQCLTESAEVEKINRAQIASGINGIVSIQKVTIVKDNVDGIPQAEIKRRVTAIRRIKGYDSRHDLYEDSWVYKDPEAFMLTQDGVDVKNANDFDEFANIDEFIESRT